MELTRIIKSPILTEKTDRLRANEKNPVFVFKVDYAANKFQIKEAVETIFQVKVASVNTIKVDKKPKKVGRFQGFTTRYKKALVTLSEGTLNYLPESNEAAKAVSEDEKTKKEEKAKRASDVEAKVAKKLAAKKVSAPKQAGAKAKTVQRRKVGGE